MDIFLLYDHGALGPAFTSERAMRTHLLHVFRHASNASAVVDDLLAGRTAAHRVVRLTADDPSGNVWLLEA